MRFTSALAACAIAFGTLLGGITAAQATDESQAVQQDTAASALTTAGAAALPLPDQDHGNG